MGLGPVNEGAMVAPFLRRSQYNVLLKSAENDKVTDIYLLRCKKAVSALINYNLQQYCTEVLI